jgi:transcriptional regulator with XRE-family HTH domain
LKYLAQNLKHLREKRNLKQAEIEAVLGIRRSTWNNYENEISKPGLDDFVRIAKIFGVTEHDLLHVNLAKKGNLNAKEGTGGNDPNSKVIGKGSGNVNDESMDLLTLKEEAAEYVRTIHDKDKLIKAQEGQIEALKLAVSQMEQRLQEKKSR